MSLELSRSTNQPHFQKSWRYKVISWLVALVVLMTVLFIGFRWIERAITFHPVRHSANENWVLPRGAEDVWFTTADGILLHGWFFGSHAKAAATVIFFHGNGGNVNNIGWVGERLNSLGFNVLVFDYRGYGRSAGRITDEAGLYADADAAYDYVLKEQKADPSTLILYGQSLGTAAVADLASRRKCAGVILESGFSSASDMASIVFPWLPRIFHRIGRNRFDSAAKLAGISCPVLITHSDPDPVIPLEHAHALFAAASEPKKLLIFPGGGHNVFGTLGPTYLDHLATFIRDSVNTWPEIDVDHRKC
jgi:fermentation-respiration switch protein FrsA (DUF1100 family)